MYKKFIKRSLDLIISLLGFIVLLPVFLVIALLVKLDSKGPVFFKQKRVGKDKKHFTIYKFRTMSVDTPRDVPTHLMTKTDKYVTKTGRFLRKSSLDELPQIINIIKGDMSIVGPRPALWNQFDLIEQRDRYGVNSLTPGLTGWAQINGRDELAIEVKAAYDGEYAKKLSFFFDLKCFFGTFAAVIKAKGYIDTGSRKGD